MAVRLQLISNKYGSPLMLALVAACGLLLSVARPLDAAPATQTSPPGLPDARAGLAIYTQKCAPCHGDAGLGNGPQAAQLQFPPAQFADPTGMWERKPADMFGVVKNGRIERFMPPFAQSTTDAQIWDVLAYVWSLHLSPDELKTANQVYQANCAGCHGVEGKGDGPQADGVLPDLSSLSATEDKSQRDWFTALTAGANGVHSSIATLSEDDRWAALEQVRAFSLPPPFTRAYEPGDGAITGQVANGTPNGDASAGLTVTLRVFDQFSMATQLTTTTSPTGTFRFDGLNTASDWFYVAGLTYAQVPYSTEVMTLTATSPLRSSTIDVYEPTTDGSGIVVEREHWFIEFDQDQLLAAELYIWSNNSDRVYIGDKPAQDGSVVSILRYSLPQGVQNLSFDDGQVGGRYQLADGGVVDTLPLPPGQGVRQALLRYTIPYQSSTIELLQTAMAPINSMNVLIADAGIKVDSPDLTQGAMQPVQGQNYFNFTAANLAPGKAIRLSLSNLPINQAPAAAATAAGEANSPLLAIAVAGFGGLILLVVVGYSLRRRAVTAGASVTEVDIAAAADEIADLQRQRRQLMVQIARLDDAFEAGEVAQDAYASQRAQHKARLLDVIRTLDELDGQS